MREPATDRQIAYAKNLRLKFPPAISKVEMSDLLTRKEEGDVAAPKWLREMAKITGAEFSRYTGKNELYERIYFELIDDEVDQTGDLIAWYVLHVGKWLLKATADDPRACGLGDDLMKFITTVLAQDDNLVAIIRDVMPQDLMDLEFEDNTAFRRTVELIKENS